MSNVSAFVVVGSAGLVTVAAPGAVVSWVIVGTVASAPGLPATSVATTVKAFPPATSGTVTVNTPLASAVPVPTSPVALRTDTVAPASAVPTMSNVGAFVAVAPAGVVTTAAAGAAGS